MVAAAKSDTTVLMAAVVPREPSLVLRRSVMTLSRNSAVIMAHAKKRTSAANISVARSMAIVALMATVSPAFWQPL